MYLKIDEDIYKKISNITMTDYHSKGEFVNEDGIRDMLDDLVYAYECEKEKLEDFKEYVKDNYREMTYAEQVGIREKDFI